MMARRGERNTAIWELLLFGIQIVWKIWSIKRESKARRRKYVYFSLKTPILWSEMSHRHCQGYQRLRLMPAAVMPFDLEVVGGEKGLSSPKSLVFPLSIPCQWVLSLYHVISSLSSYRHLPLWDTWLLLLAEHTRQWKPLSMRRGRWKPRYII